MKIKNFEYTKEDKSQRKVLQLTNTKDYIDGIDLNLLTESEASELIQYMKEHEKIMKPYIDKGFRRFSKSKMDILSEEE